MKQLTKKQQAAFEQFAKWKISFPELQARLQGAVEFAFTNHEHKVTNNYQLPRRGILVQLCDIRNAMDRHANGDISTEQLANWAAILLLNDIYQWEGPDEDEIADLLNDISCLTLKPRTETG